MEVPIGIPCLSPNNYLPLEVDLVVYFPEKIHPEQALEFNRHPLVIDDPGLQVPYFVGADPYVAQLDHVGIDGFAAGNDQLGLAGFRISEFFHGFAIESCDRCARIEQQRDLHLFAAAQTEGDRGADL